MFNKAISIFAPAYNEQDNIEKFVITVNEYLIKNFNDYEIIIINDGSSDKTKKILKKLSKTNKNLKVINHEKNKGYGEAIKDGLRESSKDLIFFTDSDLQFNICELNSFLPSIKKYDAVIGFRKKRKDNLLRVINANLWSFLVWFLLNLRVKDVNCAFKLFKKEAVEDLKLLSSGALINAELLARLKNRKYSFKELPVSHFPRNAGNQTGAKFSVILKAIAEIFLIKKDIMEEKK